MTGTKEITICITISNGEGYMVEYGYSWNCTADAYNASPDDYMCNADREMLGQTHFVGGRACLSGGQSKHFTDCTVDYCKVQED